MVKAYKSSGVRDYDNLWDGTIDTTKWTVGGAATGSGSYSQSEANGGIQVTATAFGGTGSFTASSYAQMIRSLKTISKINFVAMLNSFYKNVGSDNASCYSTISITDGGSNTVILAEISVSSHSYAGTIPSTLGAVFSLSYDGTNIVVKYCYESKEGTNSVVTLHANGGSTNVSTWANVYLKLSVNASDGGTSSGACTATIAGVELVDFFLSSNGTQ